MMLKFGMFKTKVAKQRLQNPIIAPLSFAVIKRSKASFPGLEPQQTFSEVERLVSYLAPLLEYDKAYFESMEDLGVQRRCFTKEVDEKKSICGCLYGWNGWYNKRV